MAVKEYHRPSDLGEALELRAEYGSDLTVISGGTLTIPAMNEGHILPERVMDLRSLDLDFFERANGVLSLGPTLTYNTVIEEVDDELLVKAANHCGSWAVRNVGTIGGNLFGPPTVGDFAVALMARDAEVKLERAGDERWIDVTDFYTGPGITALESEELLTEIRVPDSKGETAYLKQTRNQEPAPSIVTVAANLERDNGSISSARLGLNGGGPHPLRAREAENVLEEGGLNEATIAEAAETARELADPPTDAIASEWYRGKMIEKHLSTALNQIANGGGLA